MNPRVRQVNRLGRWQHSCLTCHSVLSRWLWWGAQLDRKLRKSPQRAAYDNQMIAFSTTICFVYGQNIFRVLSLRKGPCWPPEHFKPNFGHLQEEEQKNDNIFSSLSSPSFKRYLLLYWVLSTKVRIWFLLDVSLPGLSSCAFFKLNPIEGQDKRAFLKV